MKLRKEIKEKLANDEKKMRLALMIGVGYATVNRWLAVDDDKLTMKKTLLAISEILNIEESEILEIE